MLDNQTGLLDFPVMSDNILTDGKKHVLKVRLQSHFIG